VSEAGKVIIHHKTQKEVPCSLSIGDVLERTVEDKELWDELQHELRKRKVVTSLATKEVLAIFLRSNMKYTQVFHYTPKPLVHVIKDRETQNLHPTDTFHPRKTNTLKTLSNHTLPQFDSKNMSLGKRLGKGIQCVVYEIEAISTKPLNPLSRKENVVERTQKNNQKGKFNLVTHILKCKKQPPSIYAVKLPRHDNNNKQYKENIKELLHESNILPSVDHPNIIKIHGMSSTEVDHSDSG